MSSHAVDGAVAAALPKETDARAGEASSAAASMSSTKDVGTQGAQRRPSGTAGSNKTVHTTTAGVSPPPLIAALPSTSGLSLGSPATAALDPTYLTQHPGSAGAPAAATPPRSGPSKRAGTPVSVAPAASAASLEGNSEARKANGPTPAPNPKPAPAGDAPGQASESPTPPSVPGSETREGGAEGEGEEEEEDSEEEIYCRMCKDGEDGDELLQCDRCEKTFHPKCVGLTEVRDVCSVQVLHG